MKKKNGFVFVETMITVVILSTALLVLYSLFSNVLLKEKRRAYYDDPLYLYRANYLTVMFENIIKSASTHEDDAGVYIDLSELLFDGTTEQNLAVFTCNNDIFNQEADSEAECQQFFLDNQIYRIYISKYDLSYIDKCITYINEPSQNNTTLNNLCTSYRGLNNQAKQYFRQLPYVPGLTGVYYIVFEFYDNGNDGVCSNEKCMHQFASVKFGGNIKVINLND